MPLETVTPTGFFTETVVSQYVGNTLTIWCHDGWTDEDFDTVLKHHDLIDAPISDWEYGIVETPGGGIIESWLVRL